MKKERLGLVRLAALVTLTLSDEVRLTDIILERR